MIVLNFQLSVYIIKSKNGQFYVAQPTINLLKMVAVKVIKESYRKLLAIIETR